MTESFTFDGVRRGRAGVQSVARESSARQCRTGATGSPTQRLRGRDRPAGVNSDTVSRHPGAPVAPGAGLRTDRPERRRSSGKPPLSVLDTTADDHPAGAIRATRCITGSTNQCQIADSV